MAEKVAPPSSVPVSRSPTIASTDRQAPFSKTEETLHHEDNTHHATKQVGVKGESTLGAVEDRRERDGEAEKPTAPNVLASMPPGRKNVLLLCFCLSMFIDAAGVSATFLMTAPIANDLGVSLGNTAWILGTYSLAFASTLLFAGRLADLYPPNIIYLIGFAGLAVFYLIISFMTDQYAFFVLRAVSALLAVWTIPSSINMIIQMYPDPVEQAGKLALFGLSGALANTIALILAGVFLLASWRWYFRFITILIAPFCVLAYFIMPRTQAVAEDLPGAEKWKRMDLGGVVLLIGCLVCFILAFTQASIVGWSAAIFIAPIIIAVVLFAAFLLWEHYMPKGYSLLPHGMWSFPNIFPLIIQASAGFLWFATAQLRIATYFQDALGNSAILTAVKILPMGITALFVGGGIQAFPKLITRPRYVQPVSSALCFAGSMLFAFSGGGHGKDYWRYMFPGMIIGTAGGMLLFIGMNTCLIQAFPLESAGVGGSFVNVVFQVGGVIGIAVQAAFVGNSAADQLEWNGSKNSYFFSGGYVLATGLIFVAWYRQSKMPVREGAPVAV
ncbi:hypothetical protein P7C73_g1488, partial [Tremellales sp. Uapishka_1]